MSQDADLPQRYGQAIDYAKRCLDLSRTNYETIEVAAALRALANAQSRLDKPEEAESLFEESIAGFQAVEEPYELAIVLHDLALHGLREDAGNVDVMARVTEAERLFERLGATTWLERTRQLRAEMMKQLSRRGEGASSGRRSPRRQPDADDTCASGYTPQRKRAWTLRTPRGARRGSTGQLLSGRFGTTRRTSMTGAQRR